MSIVFRKAKKIIIAVVSLFVAAIIALLGWRVLFSDSIPKDMLTLTPTDALCEAYSRSGEDLYMFKQKQINITRGEKNNGYFSISDYVIIPDANEIQVLFRYNTSTLKRTAEDYSLDAIPSRDEIEVYKVSVLLAIDITPENKDDNLGNNSESVKFVRCNGEVVSADKKNMYNYRRIVFTLDDAEADIKKLIDDKLLLAVYADISYVGNQNVDNPDGTLCLYDHLSADVRVELEKNDVKALQSKAK